MPQEAGGPKTLNPEPCLSHEEIQQHLGKDNTQRVQVLNKQTLTPNLYYNQYYPKTQAPNYGVLGPFEIRELQTEHKRAQA